MQWRLPLTEASVPQNPASNFREARYRYEYRLASPTHAAICSVLHPCPVPSERLLSRMRTTFRAALSLQWITSAHNPLPQGVQELDCLSTIGVRLLAVL